MFGWLKGKASASADPSRNALVAREPMSLGPPLWQEFHVNMTVAAVRESRGEIAPDRGGDRLHSGAKSLLKIDRLTLAGHDYVVQFYFQDDALQQITVTSQGGATVLDYYGVRDALRLKYGHEPSETGDPTEALSFATTNWLSPDGVNISLVFAEIGDTIMRINFQHTLADAASSL